MNLRRRDQLIVSAAVLAVLATAGLVVTTVRQAEREGVRALERLQLAQVEQLTRSMNTRIDAAISGATGITEGKPWNVTLRDPSDRERLDFFQSLNPEARTGYLILDARGTVTNGTLLRDPSVLGTRLDRPGLDGVLAGKAAILPVAAGLTTPLPTIGIAYPLRKADQVVGVFMVESDVSTESNFNEEVAQLKLGRTGEFSFVDVAGVVVASSEPTLLGKVLEEPLLAGDRTGFHRGGGRVAVAEKVPSAGWRTVFRQDAAEFEGSLTGPLRSALMLIVLGGVLAAGLALVLLARRLRRAREEQTRLEEISQAREEFIGIVSHELRTPVTGLFGFLQTAADDWDLMSDDERHRAVTRSLASARSLHALTRNVLDTSGMEAGDVHYDMQVHDVGELMSEAVRLTREWQPDRVISVTMPDQPVLIRADADRFRQLLANLLENAARSSTPLSPVKVALSARAGQARLEVTDFGPAFSENELGRVFEKFVRGRASSGVGGGLGLYLCRQVVEAHGGTIHAEPGHPTGARFVVELPLVTTEPAALRD